MKNINISIITVVFNDEKNIEKTILSIIDQTYKDFEYIIIDGGSTDGTIEIIQRYEKYIHALINEPDEGLYDAMNKGYKLARGTWIFYLNSKDKLIDENSLMNAEKFLDEKSDVVHLNCKVTDEYGNNIKVRRYPSDISEITRWPCIQHQSVFTKRSSLIENNGFNLKYKILSDYDFFLRLFVKKRSFIFHRDQYISEYDAGGLSTQNNNIKNVMRELKTIQKEILGSNSSILQFQLWMKYLLTFLPFGNYFIRLLRLIFLSNR